MGSTARPRSGSSQPRPEEAERETRLTPPQAVAQHAHQRARARGNRKLRHARRARQRGPAAQGLVARRERERRRAHGDQRPLLGAHPDRHEHRPEAPPPAHEARRRAGWSSGLRDDPGRRRGRRRARRPHALHRHGRPPRRPRGLQPLPRRAEDPRAARRDLRGARRDRDRGRGAQCDHEPPRRRQAAHARGRDRPRRRRARHGEGPLADPVRARPRLDPLALRGRDRGGPDRATARRSRSGSRS